MIPRYYIKWLSSSHPAAYRSGWHVLDREWTKDNLPYAICFCPIESRAQTVCDYLDYLEDQFWREYWEERELQEWRDAYAEHIASE